MTSGTWGGVAGRPDPASAGARRKRVLLVSSSGGVLLDLLALEPWWSSYDVIWAAVHAPDTSAALAGQRVHWIGEASVRAPFRLGPSFLQAWRILRKEQPDIVVSSGSGCAIGFFWLARLLGVTTFWVSTFNLINTCGVSERICAWLASRILVQRASMLRVHPSGIVIGELY